MRVPSQGCGETAGQLWRGPPDLRRRPQPRGDDYTSPPLPTTHVPLLLDLASRQTTTSTVTQPILDSYRKNFRTQTATPSSRQSSSPTASLSCPVLSAPPYRANVQSLLSGSERLAGDHLLTSLYLSLFYRSFILHSSQRPESSFRIQSPPQEL